MEGSIIIPILFLNLILSLFIIPYFIGDRRKIGYTYTALICMFLSPIVGLIIALSSKKTEETLRKERESSKEFKKDSSVKYSLADLKEKGILTDEEYKQKVEKLEAEKAEQDLKNSTEYKQLKSLLDSNVLTKEEFENKTNLLKNKKSNGGTLL